MIGFTIGNAFSVGQDRWDSDRPWQQAYGAFVDPDNSINSSAHRLAGEKAIIVIQDGNAYAQFDDVRTGYGHGWHIFPKSCFKILYTVKNENG